MRLYQNKIKLYKNGKLHLIVMKPSGFTITYNIDSGNSISSLVSSGSSVLNYTPSKDGYTFVGWREDNTADSSVLTNKTATANMTLYAVFSKEVTVTYYNNSTSASAETGTIYYNNGTVNNPSFALAQASKSGWSARGWSTTNKGNAGITYNNNTAFTRDSNITLYGLYSASITLSYNGNGATGGSTASQSGTIYWAPAGTIGASFTLRSNGFSRSGYSFTGWNLGSAGATITLTSSTTAYAQWRMASQSFKVYMWDHENYGNGWEDLGVKSLDSNNYFSLDSNGIYMTCKQSCYVSVSYTYNNRGGDGRLWQKYYSTGAATEFNFSEGDGLSGSGSFSVSAGEKIYFQTMSHYATGDGRIVMVTSGLTFTFTATAT